MQNGNGNSDDSSKLTADESATLTAWVNAADGGAGEVRTTIERITGESVTGDSLARGIARMTLRGGTRFVIRTALRQYTRPPEVERTPEEQAEADAEQVQHIRALAAHWEEPLRQQLEEVLSKVDARATQDVERITASAKRGAR